MCKLAFHVMSIRRVSDAVLRDKSIYVLPSSSAAGSGNDDPFPAPPSSESIYRDDIKTVSRYRAFLWDLGLVN